MNDARTATPAKNVSLRSLLSFALVGGFATGVQYALMTVLIWAFDCPLVLASGIGFAVSAVANYLLNARVTFRNKKGHAHALPRFIVTALLGLGINSLLLYLLSAFGMPPIPAQIIATLTVLLWNYTLNALWTFKTSSR
jgi:putative flippase GtrA